MEDQIKVVINMPLDKRKKQQDEFNKVLDNFNTWLNSNFATSNISVATTILAAEIAAQIALNIATAGMAGIVPDEGISTFPMSTFPWLGDYKEMKINLDALESWRIREQAGLPSQEELRRLRDLGAGR